MITPRNKHVATFDVGSNTVLVCIAEWNGKFWHILHDEGEVCRLSENLTQGGLLKAAAKQRVIICLQKFKKICDKFLVDEIYAAGTAAFRKASDGPAFAKQINEELGIPLKIISGEEEARLSYVSAQHDFGWKNKNKKIGMIDIGGASTEVVPGNLANRVSIPIGTVALTEQFIKNHPVSDVEWEELRNFVKKEIKSNLKRKADRSALGIWGPSGAAPVLRSAQDDNHHNVTQSDSEGPSFRKEISWIAVAATATSLKSIDLQLIDYDGNKIHGTTLTQTRIAELASQLRQLSIEARQKISGMHPKRADVLPTGALILSELMLYLNIVEITISDHGLRHGLLCGK